MRMPCARIAPGSVRIAPLPDPTLQLQIQIITQSDVMHNPASQAPQPCRSRASQNGTMLEQHSQNLTSPSPSPPHHHPPPSTPHANVPCLAELIDAHGPRAVRVQRPEEALQLGLREPRRTIPAPRRREEGKAGKGRLCATFCDALQSLRTLCGSLESIPELKAAQACWPGSRLARTNFCLPRTVTPRLRPPSIEGSGSLLSHLGSHASTLDPDASSLFRSRASSPRPSSHNASTHLGPYVSSMFGQNRQLG